MDVRWPSLHRALDLERSSLQDVSFELPRARHHDEGRRATPRGQAHSAQARSGRGRAAELNLEKTTAEKTGLKKT